MSVTCFKSFVIKSVLFFVVVRDCELHGPVGMSNVFRDFWVNWISSLHIGFLNDFSVSFFRASSIKGLAGDFEQHRARVLLGAY